jgi:4-hydroxyproline epimerase
MARRTFFCVDAHMGGNPVRVVTGGGPDLRGDTMNARREHFLAEYDWIRTGLMFEPRGHDVMSGSILYPALRDDVDGSILFIETSGCLPMCGHGTIGTVTVMIEEGLVVPRTPGRLRLEVPAGIIECAYVQDAAGHVTSVKITNVPSFLYARDLDIDLPGIGPLSFDVAYGGNFYAIFEPQANFTDMAQFTAAEIQRLSPIARRLIGEKYTFQHPLFPTINGLRHVMWTGKPRHPEADGRNAVFYGEKAIDRSPCGTGTSARLAQKFGKGELKVGDSFVHESIIGSLFHGKVEAAAEVGDYAGMIPSIAGQAWMTGYNTIFLDDRDPFVKGFTVS